MAYCVRRLETSPPTQTQPQSTLDDGWRKTTLTVPGKIEAENDVKDGGPVAPPRKKRLSMLSPEQQPCGFAELFGNNISRRSSYDSVLNERTATSNALQQKRMSDANLSLNAGETEMKVPLPLPESETSAAGSAAILPTKPEHRLQRKISRVGNKKSDKFFGENLSDCLSDEPVTPEPQTTESAPAKDELDHFMDAVNSVHGTPDANASALKVDSVVGAEDDDDENKTSLDRKAEFLMAMLDDKNLYKDATSGGQEVIVAPKRRSLNFASLQNGESVVTKEEKNVNTEVKQDESKLNKRLDVFDDTDHYKGMEPVDEPLIVPSRRQPKPHICDDEDHLHDHIHRPVQKIEKIDQPKVDENREVSIAEIIEQIITPKKPKRDLAVYEKTIVQNGSASFQSQVEAAKEKPVPRTRHLSQGNLMSPTRPSTTIELSVSATAVDVVKTAPDSPNRLVKAEKVLKKCISQQSFLTQEMMGQIVDRVYGFKDQIDDLDDSYDDGSSKVSPHSKLTTRKISVARKEPAPIHENPSEEKSNESVRVEIISAGPIAVIHTIESPQQPTVLTTQGSVDFLNFERLHSDVPDKSPEQPSTPVNSIDSIEATINAINSTVIRPTIETITIENTTPTKHVLDDIYSSNRSILDGFQKYLDLENKAPSIATTESSTIGSSDDENTDSDITIKNINADESDIDIEVHNRILKANDGGERRDSIVEVDQWFLKHNDKSVGSDLRRDSSSSIGYDTRKVFPFGKSEPGAGTEFFDSQSKALSENISSKNETKTYDNESIEHSTLLKYLK